MFQQDRENMRDIDLQLKLDDLFYKLGSLGLQEKKLKKEIKNTILEIEKIESELKELQDETIS